MGSDSLCRVAGSTTMFAASLAPDALLRKAKQRGLRSTALLAPQHSALASKGHVRRLADADALSRAEADTPLSAGTMAARNADVRLTSGLAGLLTMTLSHYPRMGISACLCGSS